MKNRLNKIFNYFLYLLPVLFFIFSFPVNIARAQGAQGFVDKNPFGNMQVEIPGLKELVAQHPVTCDQAGKCKVPWISVYVAAVYKYAIGVVAVIATVIMMFGGFLWIIAGGNAEQIGNAKAWIGASLAGLTLMMGSYFILYQINPGLTNLKPIEIQTITAKPKISTCKINSDCASLGSGWKEKENSFCINDEKFGKADFGDKCCCPPYGGNWIFDTPSIEAQLSDASSELQNMLTCLRANLPEGVGRISSISDNAGLATCRDNWSNPVCAHKENSCHYGGGVAGKQSMAVDIGDEENYMVIKAAHDECTHFGDFFLNEGDHIHISTKSCLRN